MTDLCEKTIASLRSGEVGFNIHVWFDDEDGYSHDLPGVTAPEHCETVACLAGHIALAGGAQPTGAEEYCELGGEWLSWSSAAEHLWLDAYPGTNTIRLNEAFWWKNWEGSPTLDALESLLRQLADKERVAPVDGFEFDVWSD